MIPRLLSLSPLSTKILRAAAALAALCPLAASAQGDLVKPDRTSPTHISPYYFGPNAFPPPEMLDGSVCHDLRLELYGDYYRGFAGDYTADISLKVKVPLFTDRVNLTLWWPVMEWWSYTDKRLQQDTPFARKPREGALRQRQRRYLSHHRYTYPQREEIPSRMDRARRSAHSCRWQIILRPILRLSGIFLRHIDRKVISYRRPGQPLSARSHLHGLPMLADRQRPPE